MPARDGTFSLHSRVVDVLSAEKHYEVITRLDGEEVHRQAIADPFINNVTDLLETFTWRERLAVLFGRKIHHEFRVVVNADRDVVNAVMRLSRCEDGSIDLPEPVRLEGSRNVNEVRVQQATGGSNDGR